MKRMVKSIAAMVLLLAVVLAAAGCGSDDSKRYPGSGSKPQKSR